MDGGRRKDGEWHSSSGGRSLSSRTAEVKGSKPISTHPRPNINSLTRSVDGGPRMSSTSGGARRTGGAPVAVPPLGRLSVQGRTVTGSSSTFTHGISSRVMSMGEGRMDIAAPNLAGSSYKKGTSMDAGPKTDTKTARRNPGQEDAAKRHGKPPRSEVFPDQTAYSGAEPKKFQVRQDPRSHHRSIANKLDLRRTVNIGARDAYGWEELMGKSGAEDSLLYLKKQMAEIALSSRCRYEADQKWRPPSGEEKVKLTSIVVERDTAESVAESVRARVKAADMPSTMQIHAFRCARRAFDSQTAFSSKQLAFALKKEFDKAYGVAWHCIVGTSFGSFVTHSAGGFLYFSFDKVAILLFKTAVERLESDSECL